MTMHWSDAFGWWMAIMNFGYFFTHPQNTIKSGISFVIATFLIFILNYK